MIINEVFRKLFRLPEAHCESCDVLQKQLEVANYEKGQLLGHILDFTKPKTEEKFVTREIDPIRPRAMPFSVRRQMLEAEDRAKADILRKQQQDIENLERETGLTDNKEESNG